MAKRLSKAAKAALIASGKAPEQRNDIDVRARLKAIDPGFSEGAPNPFLQDGGNATAAAAGLHDDDPITRAAAVEALGVLRHKPSIAGVKTALGDADREVRTNAAVALIRIGDDVLFPEIVKALRHDDPRVVIGAAVALGRLADARVVPNLVEAFKTDNPEVGAAVAWAIGQCNDPAALPWLITALEQGFATANVCEALGRIGDARAQPALLSALGMAGDDTRAYAARALGLVHQGGRRAPSSAQAGKLSADKATAKLRGLLADPSRKVRLCAAIALYEMGEPLGKEAVVSALDAPSG